MGNDGETTIAEHLNNNILSVFLFVHDPFNKLLKGIIKSTVRATVTAVLRLWVTALCGTMAFGTVDSPNSIVDLPFMI